MLLFKTMRQFDLLIKGHIAIVVCMNQQHGRLPLGYVRIRRGGECGIDRLPPLRTCLIPMLGKLLGLGQEWNPIPNTVEVHACFEDIGVASEREAGEITTVGAAPDGDAAPVHAPNLLEIASPGERILILGCARRPSMLRMLKGSAIADAQPVVHRE